MYRKVTKPFYAAFTREIERIKTKPIIVTVAIVLPVLTFLFFLFLFISGVPRNFEIGVVDNDNSVLSRALIEMVNESPDAVVSYRPESIRNGKEQLEKEKFYGLLIIPEGFSEKIKCSERPQVVFFYNEQFIVAGGNLNRGVTTSVRMFSAGVNIASRVKKGENKAQALASAVPIIVNTKVMFNAETNYFYYLVPVLLPVMLLMFIMQITVYSIGSELKNGTSKEWLENSDNVIALALAGKLTPYFIIFSILAVVMNTLLFQFFGVPSLSSQFYVHLAAIIFVISYMSMGIVLISIMPSMRESLSITSIYAALAFTFSGLTFPFMSMPEAAEIASNAFPLTHYVKILILDSFQGAPDRYLLVHFAALLCFIVLPYIFLGRLNKIAKNEKYWYKL